VRHDGREPDELRAVSFRRDFTTQADGSVLVTAGDTMVLCTASVDDGVPRWMKGSGKGWASCSIDAALTCGAGAAASGDATSMRAAAAAMAVLVMALLPVVHALSRQAEPLFRRQVT